MTIVANWCALTLTCENGHFWIFIELTHILFEDDQKSTHF